MSRRRSKGRDVTNLVPLDSRRRERTVLEKIREAWKTWSVVLPEHGDQRLEDSGFSDADIWNCLKHGRLLKTEIPIRLDRHTIRGKSVDGAGVICAVELDEEHKEIILVTVYEEVIPD